MAYEWQMIRENLAGPVGSEQWNLITLSASPDPIAYGFRLTYPTAPPDRWNTAGYFGVLQLAGGKTSMSRTHPIPLYGSPSDPVIRLIGPGDIDVVAQGNVLLSVIYMVHSWIDADKAQVWGYYEV